MADRKQDAADYQAKVKKYHEARSAAYAKKQKAYNAEKAKRNAAYRDRLEDAHEKTPEAAETPRR